MPGAYVSIIGYGRSASMNCPQCGILRVYDRTEKAQADAQLHNIETHPETIRTADRSTQ
jgi:hypothetical protein